MYFYKFNAGLSSKQDVWGQFGDFMGGTLNPLLGFLTVLILLSTLKVQQVELRQARRAVKKNGKLIDSQISLMKQQSLENTFFKLLEDYNNDPVINKCKEVERVKAVYFGIYAIREMKLGSPESAKEFMRVTDGFTIGEFDYVIAEKLMIMTDIATKLKHGNIHIKLLQTTAGIALISTVIHRCKYSGNNYEVFKKAKDLLRGVNPIYIFDDEIARHFLNEGKLNNYLESKEENLAKIAAAMEEADEKRR